MYPKNHSSEPNEEYSAKIAAYLEKTIGVSSDRGYMYYCHPIFFISRVLITWCSTFWDASFAYAECVLQEW